MAVLQKVRLQFILKAQEASTPNFMAVLPTAETLPSFLTAPEEKPRDQQSYYNSSRGGRDCRCQNSWRSVQCLLRHFTQTHDVRRSFQKFREKSQPTIWYILLRAWISVINLRAVQAREDRSTLPSLDLKGLRNLLFRLIIKTAVLNVLLLQFPNLTWPLWREQTKQSDVANEMAMLVGRLTSHGFSSDNANNETRVTARNTADEVLVSKKHVTLIAILCFNGTNWWIRLKSGCRLQLGQPK